MTFSQVRLQKMPRTLPRSAIEIQSAMYNAKDDDLATTILY